jgi:hypothetical protein
MPIHRFLRCCALLVSLAILLPFASRAGSWVAIEGEGVVENPRILAGQETSTAWAVSGTGYAVVGISGSLRFRWTPHEGMRALSDPLGIGGRAFDVSYSGYHVVGDAFGISGGAFEWTRADGMFSLAIPEGWSITRANAVGSGWFAIVGSAGDGESSEAMLWRRYLSDVRLGTRPRHTFAAARDVSYVGDVVIGESGRELGDETLEIIPFIWSEDTGMLSAETYLAAAGVDFGDWTIDEVTAISDDGTCFVGTATNAQQESMG